MPDEIERKFIVPLEHHALFVGREGGVTMTQAYLSSSSPTVRVRVVEAADGSVGAKITVKGKSSDGGLVRSEWEWPIPVEEAREVIARLNPPSLTKTRHVVRNGDDLWEVDVLRVNEVAGRPPGMWRYLVVAEYEAPTLEQVRNVVLPAWVGRDVTDDLTFAMSHLTTEAARDLAWRKAYL